ncbi:MAG: ABC transporter ATP-binding protein [Acetatifactor sp.]|nr:ABC transporter ATP-binding protein [Acetatifactor sp.]
MNATRSLNCKNVTKKYGDKIVLNQVNFTLEEGKIYGLIGRNGAGKTTLLSILAAHAPLTEGEVLLDEETVWENTNALQYICFSRELNLSAASPLWNMRVKEYLRMAAIYFPFWDQMYADKLIKQFELNTKEKFGKLSKGMLSMVTIIVALASKAPFTFLDEPVAGLDVVMRRVFYKLLLEEYTLSGRTFVISTHIIEEVSDVLEEVLIIDKGKLLLKENTVELLEKAVEVSGLSEVVDKAVNGLDIQCVETVGRRKHAVVLLKEDETIKEEYDVTVKPVGLQDLFVAMCGNEA